MMRQRDPEVALEDLCLQVCNIAISVACCTPEAAAKIAEVFAEFHPHLMMDALEKRAKQLAEQVKEMPRAQLVVMPQLKRSRGR